MIIIVIILMIMMILMIKKLIIRRYSCIFIDIHTHTCSYFYIYWHIHNYTPIDGLEPRTGVEVPGEKDSALFTEIVKMIKRKCHFKKKKKFRKKKV